MWAEINSWLNNPSRLYGDGLQLYLKYGSNEAWKRVLLKGEGTYSRSVLLEELKKLLKNTPEPIKTERPKRYTEQKVVVIDKTKLPENLKEKDFKKAELFKQMAAARRKLSIARTKQERYLLAKEVLDLDDQIADIWAELDHFQKTGEVITLVENEIKNPALWAKRVESLKSYVRRAVKRGTEPKQVEEWKNEIEKYQKKIKEYAGT